MNYAKQVDLVFKGIALDTLMESLATLDRLFPKPARSKAMRKSRCSGLPRVYPREWMKRPRSNSLMFEFKTLQARPTSGLRSLDD